MTKLMQLSVFILASQFCVVTGWASGADFKLFNATSEVTKVEGVYTAEITVGQTLEIIAKGWAYPRSRDPEIAKGQPMKARAGTWMFDDTVFKLLKTESVEGQHKISLRVTKPGQHKLRFVGVVLGYNKSCELLVTVAEKKE